MAQHRTHQSSTRDLGWRPRRRLPTIVLLIATIAMIAAPAAVAEVSLRGVSTASRNAATTTIPVPDGTQPGDALLLFVSVNRSAASMSQPGGDWILLDEAQDGSLRSWAWTVVADEASSVRIQLSERAKTNVVLVAYAGGHASTPVLAHAVRAEPGAAAAHTTPTMANAPSGSRVVSYWADKSSSTTAWTPPPSTSELTQVIGTGGGRVTSLAVDQAATGGPVGALTAVASSANQKAVMWTVVMAPADGGDPPPPPPPPPTGVVRWDMNEPIGAPVMRANGGNGPDGDIGDEVGTGRSVMGATAYGFPWVKPNTPPARPGHLVVVPDDPRIDPQAATYSVSIRMRSQQNFGNVLQKGQATANGGMWKFQMPNGLMQCLFRGSQGTRTATSISPVNDGQWHVITCERSPNAVTMWVDGERRGRRPGATGTIDNSSPLTIGGKPFCDQIDVTCDYFTGAVDWVEITKR